MIPTVLAAIMSAVFASGCLTSVRPALRLWLFDVPGDPYPVTPENPGPPDSSLLSHQARLRGAISETLCFSFAVQAGDEPLDELDFRVEPLRSAAGAIGPSAVRLFRMHRVDLRGNLPGWHVRSVPPDRRVARPLDVLVPIDAPIGGLPRRLTPGQTIQLWVDLTIPKGTSAGSYIGAVVMTAGESSVACCDIDLEVYPFVLPDSAEIPAIVELDHRALIRHHVELAGKPFEPGLDDWRDLPVRGEIDSLLMSTLRMLQEHRLTPVLSELTPIVKVTVDGGLLVDWGQYDSLVGPCITGEGFANRVPSAVWPMPVGRFAEPLVRGRASAPGSSRLLAQFMVECGAHFDQKGWTERSYAMLPGDMQPGIESSDLTHRFAEVVRKTAPHASILSRLFPQDMGPYGWTDYPRMELSGAVDIWMPPAQFYDPWVMAGERSAGRRTWLVVDRPPFGGTTSVHAAACDVRVLSWQALELGTQALFAGCVNRWDGPVDEATPVDCLAATGGDGVLLYPGRSFGLKGPVASVRLKHLRRSMADAAYVKLLKDHGLAHVTQTLRRALAPDAGTKAYRTHFADGRRPSWPGDQGVFESARSIMANILKDKVLGRKCDDPSELFAHNAGWRRFMLSTRRLSIAIDGVRVRPAGGPSNLSASVECAITLVNHKRVPVSGTIAFGQLPGGWTTPDGEIEVSTIAPNGSRRMTLTAEAYLPATDAAGVLMLPLTFTTDQGMVHQANARLTCVTAVPCPAGITIDGDLSDWPAGAANVASDFVLITGEPTDPVSDCVTRPRNATTALVMRDDKHLYIAINAGLSSPLDPTVSRRKSVEYDDMIPTGEELIEVLVNPTNAGTRSPTDLYHIVVKSNGTDLCESGIRFDPPCGQRRTWPVDLDVATRTHADRWVVELAVPLPAFGEGATENHIWGFNLTRLDEQNQEMSTWSGAVGNAYDPLAMGNLLLPQVEASYGKR